MKRIRTEKDYEAAITRIEELLDTPETERDNNLLEKLTAIITAYEEEHYAITPPPVAAALQFRMDQQGLTQAEVSRITGIHKSKISEILSGIREPSKEHIKALHSKLGIPLHHLLCQTDQSVTVETDYSAKTAYPDISRLSQVHIDHKSLRDQEDLTESDTVINENAPALTA